ncbi:transcriptional repressor [bacterium]|jgi:Fur family transcriptional regulator, peroxide stress response regulator|nr:transcriptional repressor [bacterium]MBT4552004.1 transcriptional repressor [bacterium]MBT5988495.1 transcriptional repressor [bacterium]MBT7087700.1 transcriptional repressor [bacterium]
MKSKDEILEKLKEKEVKITPQRIAIIDYLIKNPIHPTAENVYIAVSKKHPNISLATVYNTLEKLEAINEIIKLKMPCNNKIHFEYNLKPHSHFYCKECHKLLDIWDAPNIWPDDKRIAGHQIEEANLCYKGICKDCLKNTKKSEIAT